MRLLWPLSQLYRALQAWHARRQRPIHAGVPVIVVGNVIAGGAGQPPVTQAVVTSLQQHGWQPGIVSRGYGRRTTDCRQALPDGPAHEVGDAAALLARTTGAPVFVARQRIEAVQALRAHYPAANIIVSDDGLQHLALARDIELCVSTRTASATAGCCPLARCANPGRAQSPPALYAGQPPPAHGQRPSVCAAAPLGPYGLQRPGRAR